MLYDYLSISLSIHLYLCLFYLYVFQSFINMSFWTLWPRSAASGQSGLDYYQFFTWISSGFSAYTAAKDLTGFGLLIARIQRFYSWICSSPEDCKGTGSPLCQKWPWNPAWPEISFESVSDGSVWGENRVVFLFHTRLYINCRRQTCLALYHHPVQREIVASESIIPIGKCRLSKHVFPLCLFWMYLTIPDNAVFIYSVY